MTYSIITDIHEDIVSLREVTKVLGLYKNNKIVCLGDIVGFSLPYYRSFIETKSAEHCVFLIKQNCDISIIGNHDLNAISKIPENSIFEYPVNWGSIIMNEKKNISKGKLYLYEDELPSDLSLESKKYLTELHESVIQNGILFSHFLFPNLTGSDKVYGNDIEIAREHFRYMIKNDCHISFVGHLHRNGIRIISSKKVYDLEKDTVYYLDQSDIYIILCPPIVAIAGNIPSYVIFDEEDLSVFWSTIE